MPRMVFTGSHTPIYLDYVDVNAGKTLEPEPGGVYDVLPVRGGVDTVPPGFILEETIVPEFTQDQGNLDDLAEMPGVEE